MHISIWSMWKENWMSSFEIFVRISFNVYFFDDSKDATICCISGYSSDWTPNSIFWRIVCTSRCLRMRRKLQFSRWNYKWMNTITARNVFIGQNGYKYLTSFLHTVDGWLISPHFRYFRMERGFACLQIKRNGKLTWFKMDNLAHAWEYSRSKFYVYPNGRIPLRCIIIIRTDSLLSYIQPEQQQQQNREFVWHEIVIATDDRPVVCMNITDLWCV